VFVRTTIFFSSSQGDKAEKTLIANGAINPCEDDSVAIVAYINHEQFNSEIKYERDETLCTTKGK
jgi:hypothetical protein